MSEGIKNDGAAGAPQAPQGAGDTTAAPAAPVVIEGGLSLYPVLSPLNHDGKRYAPDDPDANLIALDPKEAKALQAIGVLGEASTDADVSAALPKPKGKAKK